MKPIYIEMKAFGSYRDEKIDFTGKSQGLFLITGDTGAGKTTIFDAICYALYGETSGGKRSGEMMCSQFAKPGEKTEVRWSGVFGYEKSGSAQMEQKRGAVKDNDGHKGESYIAGWYRICRENQGNKRKNTADYWTGV